MEPHQIPRQITTFEFKLIGFLTIKQFLYIILFGGIGLIVYLTLRIPFLNIILAIAIGSIGVAFAYGKYNERPLDIWVKNLFIRLTTPSQYYYKKNNDLPQFLQNIPRADAQTINAHVDAQKKVEQYLQQNTTPDKIIDVPPIAASTPIVHQVVVPVQDIIKSPPQPLEDNVVASNQTQTTAHQNNLGEQPFIKGVLANNQGIKLPNIMVYIKDINNNPIRMMKTDVQGVFTSYRPLPLGDYTLEAKDLGDSYYFDKTNVQVSSNTSPLEFNIQSKEVI